MQNIGSENKEHNVVISIDGAEIQFAQSDNHARLVPGSIRKYQTADFPTATDCVMGYGRDMNITLSGRDCAIAVSGAIQGNSIRVARCPWIISTTGFGYLFGRPVLFLNDCAAVLWASIEYNMSTHRAIGAIGTPDYSEGGKWVSVILGGGVGVALLVSNEGHNFYHVETELGHTAFSPGDAVEQKLAENLARSKSPVSWERALTCEASDPAWNGTAIAGNTAQIQNQRVLMLGSFVGDVILSMGAWNGVFLTGKGTAIHSNAAQVALFQKRLFGRANHQSLLRRVPIWDVTMQNMNLLGAARYLRQHTAVV